MTSPTEENLVRENMVSKRGKGEEMGKNKEVMRERDRKWR